MTPQRTSRSARRQYWQRHMKAWSSSGQTQAQYCRDHSLNAWTFSSWKKKLAQSPSPSPRFVAVNLPSRREEEESNVSGLCLKLSNGMCIEVSDDFSQQTLKRLIETVTTVA